VQKCVYVAELHAQMMAQENIATVFHADWGNTFPALPGDAQQDQRLMDVCAVSEAAISRNGSRRRIFGQFRRQVIVGMGSGTAASAGGRGL
jgi:histidinol phosphatase-like PHP family hydrolase